MIIRFTPPLPCDVRTSNKALCGMPAERGLLRCDIGGWHLTPICPECAQKIARSIAPRPGRHTPPIDMEGVPRA